MQHSFVRSNTWTGQDRQGSGLMLITIIHIWSIEIVVLSANFLYSCYQHKLANPLYKRYTVILYLKKFLLLLELLLNIFPSRYWFTIAYYIIFSLRGRYPFIAKILVAVTHRVTALALWDRASIIYTHNYLYFIRPPAPRAGGLMWYYKLLY